MVDSVAIKLDKSRQALLDLSTRNRLLSIPKRASSKLLNIYDELTSEVYRLLVTEGKAMTFLHGRVAPGAPAEDSGDEESAVSLPQPEDDEVGGLAGRHTDTRLQTKLASDRLQHRLLEMYYDARTFIEEQGVNILYLALGQLRWFDGNSADKERLAPLILLPVTLARKSARDRFSLSWLEEDAAENLSLAAKLKADFGVILPEFKAGDDFDPTAYLDQVASAVACQKDWEVRPNAMVLGFFSFAKFLMYRDLDPANWPEGQRIDQQRLIVGVLQDGFPARGEIFPEDVHIDQIIPVAEQRHVVDADSSQSLAIEAVRKGEHLVIQGPPGTGKSQTITNVIAAAVADGKKVLFVSEKMAALEVVYRRLQAIGLGPACLELHSNRSNKRHVLEELKATRDLGRPKVEQREQVIQELGRVREELNGHAALMHAPIKPCETTPYRVIGNLVRLHDIKLVGLPPLLDQAETWRGEEFRARKDLVHELQAKAGKIGIPGQHPWRGVGHVALLKLDADELIEQVPAVQQSIVALVDIGRQLAESLGQSPANTPHELQAQIELSRLIGSAPTLDRAAVAHAIWASGLRDLGNLVELGCRFQASYAQLQQSFAESAWRDDMETCRHRIAAHGDSWLRLLVGDYRQAITTLKAHLKTPLPKTLHERLQLLDALIESQQLRKSLAAGHGDGVAAFGSLWRGEQSDWTKLKAVVQWMSGRDGQGIPEQLRSLYAQLPSPEQCAQLGRQAAERLRIYQKAGAELVASYRLDLLEAFGIAAFDAMPFAALNDRLAVWLAQPGGVFDWTQYYAVRQRAREGGLAELVNQFERGVIPRERLDKSFERAYYERLLRAVSHRAPQLAAFDGEQHSTRVEMFRTLDRRRIELARAEAALKHFEQIPRSNGGIGPMGVLNSEIARKRAHMPLRKLFKMAGQAIQAIKPVFMMSPLSVAQFLEPGTIEFDMLVIDEASQIEPVDALGAVARCRQLVIVGDDRQLPPTRFFARMTSEIDVEEDDDESYVAGAADVESILSLCIAKGVPQMMLRWHYRSRHESLIAVSNQQFYKNELFIVPSPYTAAAGMGLRFNYVQNGLFDSGGTRVNREEAKVIAAAVIRHALTSPQQSLGVAAFSLKQKVAIQDELELLRRQHPETEAFFNDHPTEPFFIKNLENVQGDERDVIFISVAYARNSNGYLTMKFGPVSADGGERRLNVLISRAKLRCEVFSSIKADDIDLERGKGKGTAALKVFLSYAETGRLSLASRSDRELDSPFEEEVKLALERAGLTVHPKIGIAGFFIDLAIVDPEQTGRYLLGIECDGAGYHASRSARDRDRLRQAVLEDHGWILHRVWSNDWFRQPEVEMRKLLAALEAAKAELAARQELGNARNRADSVQINFVDREDHSIVELTTAKRGVEAYEEARITVPSHLALHEVPVGQLAHLVRQVIEAEGPIHFDEVVTRIRSLWGLQRAGSRIREALDRATDLLLKDQTVVMKAQFVDVADRIARVRNRSLVSSTTLRKPEYLPPAEIAEAIKSVLRENFGGREEELPTVVAKLLGFSAVSAQLREVILTGLEQLRIEGRVTVFDSFYRVSGVVE